jgi:Na+/H+-translocating membrane pyrophosphatase
MTTPDAVYFPLIVTAVGIGASFLSVQFVHIKMSTENKLRTQLIVSSILMSIACVPILWYLPD